MRTQLTITLFFSLMVSVMLAQDFTGIATYKTQRKMELQLDSTMNDAMQEQIQAMLKKQFQQEYTLEFDKNQGVYKRVQKLDDKSTMSSGGMQIVIAGSGSNNVRYSNVEENRLAYKNEIFGKVFLIKDELEEQQWVMTKETKNIGEYLCFKATYEDTREVRSFSTGDEDEEGEETVTEEAFTVTAWYTPQIPVKLGPDDYHGLPGLILEVNDGTTTMLCSKVVLNPKDGVDLTEPKTGKVVTQEEFREIMDAKMEEMNEQYQSDGRRNGQRGFQIRIGG
ncbi:GLPGLI family protein [Aureitalea marina]|uniref:GLPGLI family protein n=1 Tax=Aureitalea marina TaxID=930804 RepID=A0A2S7KR34_9FLAO|nr:GLPGLI family protein [Aureitalea marina]PQB05048.1 hypothetical protein BST85_09190 [Aureitalea marina]